MIIYVDEAQCQPDLETLKKCYERNSDQHNTEKGNKDGVGISWHDAKGNPRYVKGMYKPEEIYQLLDHYKVTVPYAIHFRASSVGSPVEQLIHPFEIDLNVPHQLEGTPVNGCVMQNGTWHNWADKVLALALMHRMEIPDGPWNDARAIAWIMALTGFNTVDFLLDDIRNPSRLIAFLPNGEVKLRGDWTPHEGMWFSQMKWNEEPKKAEPPKEAAKITVIEGTTTTEVTKKPTATVIIADSFLNDPQRENIARHLKFSANKVKTHEVCLMQVMTPHDPRSGDKCGRCGNECGHRYGCKDLPKKLWCQNQGCFNYITNPKISVSQCQECMAKMATSVK